MVVPDVVDPQGSFEDLCAIEVINSKDSRTLILIHGKSEASGCAGLLVTRHVDVHDFAVPGRRFNIKLKKKLFVELTEREW